MNQPANPKAANRLTAGCKSAFAPIAASYFALPIRLVLGWLFFSAFWRRVVLEPPKMDMESAKWVGHKINHFYPNAILIKPLLGWSIENPNVLWYGLVAFTIVEGLVGLGVFFGLLTRISALGISLLSLSILLGAGWLGTTCLDEWQIGALGIVGGMALWFTGAGPYSLDQLIAKRWPSWTTGWKAWFTDGQILTSKAGKNFTIAVAIFSLFVTLATNQAFAGGVWGKLHNLSAHPHVVVSDVKLDGDQLTFTVYRDEGPDTSGGSVIDLQLRNTSGEKIVDLYGKDLSKAMKEAKADGKIKNYYINGVKPGPDGMAIPLGGKATITLKLDKVPEGAAKLVLRGANQDPNQPKKLWEAPVK